MNKSTFIFITSVSFGLLINPFITYWVVILYLFTQNNKLERKTILSLVYSAVILLAFIYSSRLKGAVINDDFVGYYDEFIALDVDNLARSFTYGSGLEIGLPLLNFLIKSIFGNINRMALMFFYSCLILLLFVYAFQRVFLTDNSDDNLGLKLAVLVALLPAFYSTQLVRQSFSLGFLLLSLKNDKWQNKTIWLFFGTIFHTSCLLYFVIFQSSFRLFIIKNNMVWLLIFSGVLTYFVKQIIEYSVLKYFIFFGKMQGFSIGSEVLQSSITTLYYIVVLSLLNLFSSSLSNNKMQYRKSFAILLPSLFVVYATLDMGYFAYRFALLFSFLMGYFLVLSFADYNRVVKLFLLAVMLWYGYVMIKSYGAMGLWNEYNIYDILPILNLFSPNAS